MFSESLQSDGPEGDARVLGWPWFLILAGVALIAIFTLLDPGQTSALPLPATLLFWTLHIAGPLALLEAVQMALGRVPVTRGLQPWAQTVLAALIGAALFAPVALGLDALFGLAEEPGEAAMPLALRSFEEFTGLAPLFVLVWCGLNATRLIRIASPRRVEDDAPPPDADLFWARLPRALGTEIVALSAELHYLRVFTPRGDALILHPIGAAADRLSDVPGMRIHRSHWVALDHVADVQRAGGRIMCVTTTGLSLPVSRSNRAAFEAALSEMGPAFGA